MEDQQALARALLEKLELYASFLDEVFNKIVKKLGNKIKASRRFFDLLIENAKEIAKTVNPIGAIVSSVRYILNIFDVLKARLRFLRKVVAKIIGLLRRGMNNLTAVVGQVAKLMKGFVRDFRVLLVDMTRLAAETRAVSKVLALVARVRRMLQLIFAWIDGVTGASSAMAALVKALKKMAKMVRLYLRQLKTLPKEVRTLAKA